MERIAGWLLATALIAGCASDETQAKPKPSAAEAAAAGTMRDDANHTELPVLIARRIIRNRREARPVTGALRRRIENVEALVKRVR